LVWLCIWILVGLLSRMLLNWHILLGHVVMRLIIILSYNLRLSRLILTLSKVCWLQKYWLSIIRLILIRIRWIIGLLDWLILIRIFWLDIFRLLLNELLLCRIDYVTLLRIWDLLRFLRLI
jgi:hypothetical protein